MAWRSSFGATVLLALVALHSSTALPTVHDMLAEMSGLDKIRGLGKDIDTKARKSREKMLDMWQNNESRCRDLFFDSCLEWYRWACVRDPQMLSASTCTRAWGIVQKWKVTCHSRLEKKIQSGLAAMSASTREQFKLFAEQDKREYESNSEWSSFDGSISLIAKLRQSIGSPRKTDADELRAAEGFVSACKEMAASKSIKTARTKYEKETPSSPEPHFPHIRFYDYCRRMLKLDLSIEKIDEQNHRAAIRFFEKLAEIQERSQSKATPEALLSETAENVRELERSVAEAAVQIAEQNSNLIRRAGDTEWVQAVENELKLLRDQCSYVLDQVDNLIWMHQHMYDILGRTRWSQDTAYAKRNLMYSETCRQLGKLDNEKIIKTVTEEQKPRSLFSNIKLHLGINRT
jgi:hypothetical protein